jgi:hypothetical protein
LVEARVRLIDQTIMAAARGASGRSDVAAGSGCWVVWVVRAQLVCGLERILG